MRDEEVLEAQAEIFGSLFLLSQHVARRADTAMEPAGITTKQWLLLAVLQKVFPGDRPSLSDAARWYGSSRQNVKQIAEQLQARGFVRLVANPDDARSVCLELTPKISELDAPAEAKRQRTMLADLFSGFTPNDVLRLRALMRRWAAALSPR